MKRMHLHVSVPDLAQSIRFYQTLFGAPPSVVKPDYAKWMLDDPRVNFAISARGRAAGVDHIGIQADPAGVRWETFFTYGEATTYGEDQALAQLEAAAAEPARGCCGGPAVKDGRSA